MAQGKSVPDFKMYSAHELAAQRIVAQGDVEAERTVPEESKIVEGDWVYCIEQGDDADFEQPYAMVVGYSGSDAHVAIPAQLGGLEVGELFNQVFARNASVQSVTMPDSVRCMGFKTFFQCANLHRVVLSNAITELDPQTFAGCRALASVHLPDALRSIPKRLLFDCPVEQLVIPAAVEKIEDQAYDPKKLGRIEVDPANGAYSTDGIALYDAYGEELIALAVQVGSYRVIDTCTSIGDSAFKGQTTLESIEFGPKVEVIRDFAFFRTGLADMVFPASLVAVGDSAFSLCAKLESVTFNEGLEQIGAQAFAKTPMTCAKLPSTLKTLGQKAFERTKIAFDDPESFLIDASNPTLSTDGKALYQDDGAGLTLCCLLSEQREYEVLAGTVAIAEGAFERESKLERVILPEGLRTIGAKAFKACEKLTEVNLPDSLEVIGEEAFWQTSLAAAHIGPHVAEIGPFAFEVAGASRKHERRTLKSIEVDPANSRYYFEENILIERGEQGDRALMFVEPRDYVAIPQAVTHIAETAFYHAHVREMRFHSNIRTVDPRALLGIDNIDRVYVEFPEPVDGFSEVTVEFPYQARDMEDFTRPLCIDDDGLFFDFATYDSMVVHEIDPTTVVRMIFARFDQPVKLSEASRAHFEAAIKGFMNQILRRYAQEGNFAGYDELVRHGYLDEETRSLAMKIAQSEQCEEAVEYLKSMA